MSSEERQASFRSGRATAIAEIVMHFIEGDKLDLVHIVGDKVYIKGCRSAGVELSFLARRMNEKIQRDQTKELSEQLKSKLSVSTSM